MAQETTAPTIDQLLQERARFQDWLAKLTSSGSSAPAAVRERVEKDYRARLGRVMEQLLTHADALKADLERQRAREASVREDRNKAQEDFDEASLRYDVGEYGEEEWKGISQKARAQLAAYDSELESVAKEIGRLAEVQRLIDQPGPKAEVARAVEAAAPAPAAEPPKPVPAAETKAAEPPKVAAELPFLEPPLPAGPTADDLAFLKSVPGAASPTKKGAVKMMAEAVAPAETPAAVADATKVAKKAPGAERTLKCNECGTANRASEWYCEKCGAELTEV